MLLGVSARTQNGIAGPAYRAGVILPLHNADHRQQNLLDADGRCNMI